jgi:nucleoid-associated protein YgaU
MMGRLLRRLGALVVLLTGTVGAPIALWTFGRTLIPDHLPGAAELWAALTTPDNGRTLATAMLLAGTVLWLVFLGCVLLDLAARLTHRPTWRLPGLRVPQTIAAGLIGLVLAGTVTITGAPTATADPLPTLPHGSTAITATATAAPRTTTPVPDPVPTALAAPAASVVQQVPAGPEWTVRKGDTLWAIARTTLSDPFRYTEIVALNTGRAQPDGRALTNGDWLQPGWILTLPADAHLPADITTGTTVAGGTGGGMEVTVARGDTLSGIAADHHRDTADVWAANAHRPEPGGAALTDPDLIYPGWIITIPAAAPPAPAPDQPVTPPGQPVTPARQPVTPAGQPVTPAAPEATAPGSGTEHTGAPTTPDAPAAGASGPEGQPLTPAAAAPDQPVTPPVTPTRPAETPPPAAPAAPAATGPTATTGEPVTPAPTPAAPPVTGAPVPAVTAPATAAAPTDGDLSLALAAAGAAFLAGGVYATLRRSRRRQERRRRAGRTFPPPTPDLIPLEQVLATTGRAGHLDATFLHRALQSLATRCATDTLPLPDVVAARLSTAELELRLHRPTSDAPTPWAASGDGTRWTLSRTDPSPAAETGGTPGGWPDHPGRPAPFPTLVSIAHTGDGDHWLVDLERMGTAVLTGDPARCRLLARHIAAELGHNAWSDLVRVTVVGWAAELADLSPGRVDVHTIAGRVFTAAAAQHREIRPAAMEALDGRRDDVTVDAFAPHILIIDPAATDFTPDDAAGMAELAALLDTAADGPRSTVALLLAAGTGDGGDDAVAGRWRIEVDPDGTLRVPELGMEGAAEQLSAGEARQIAQVLRAAADTTDHPAPPAPGDQPWDTVSDSLGSLLPQPGVSRDRDVPVVHLADTVDDADYSTSVLPLPAGAYTTAAAVTPDDLKVLAPMVSTAARQRVHDADPGLDADLADWHDLTNPRPKITVLGPVEVLCTGDLPDGGSSRAAHTEVVAYLATRPRGATVLEYARAVFGERDVDLYRPGTGELRPRVRKLLYTTRHWLGQDPATGQFYLPFVTGVRDPVYRLHGALLDAELFRRLRLRAATRPPATGIPDLETALRLVTGEPFDRRREHGYQWLQNNQLDAEYRRMITDTAQIVAVHHLHTGHPAKAIAPCQVALLAGADSSDKTLCNLYRAHLDLGDQHGADRHLQALLNKHDIDEEIELPPETFAMLHGNQWSVG